MGLDMYLEKISAPTFGDKTNRVGIEYYEKECKTIKKFAVIKDDIAKYHDLEKIAKDYEMDKESIYCSGWGSDGWNFRDDYADKSTKISLQDVEEKYTIEKTEQFYFYDTEETAYQRKGLNDKGWELLETIGNCVSCDKKAQIKKIVKEGGLSEDFINNWINGKTVFHAWW